MRTWAFLPLSILLGACAFSPPAPESSRFLADQLFGAPSERVDAGTVFAASESMKRYLRDEIGILPGSKGRQQVLIEKLRSKGQLKLEYDAAFTRNAAQAFEARTGNCLSLVIMTAAFAREMGIEVRYQNVFVDETWSRQGDLYFSIGHVNLTLGRRPPALGTRIDDGEQLTIDFMPPRDTRGMNWRVIGEKTILAMYMNNRAAESLTAGKTDDAYWFAREAILQDPEFMTPYNTLGVVYQRSGHLGQAERIFAYALEREPRNTHAMSNMATVLAGLGRVAEAQALERRLAQLEPEPPFSNFNRGVAAMREGDFRAARDLFAKEVDRDPGYHEFHFWLALALANLGETERAKRHLALAMEYSTTRKDHDIYAAKLDRIRSSRLH
ncbi:MAG TPA: tetratricopeptide repeat protein [Usitatibacteraceae bacterium]|nr:tetratricopeptide repeat protein [Usitatibacteraceae bacterium]